MTKKKSDTYRTSTLAPVQRQTLEFLRHFVAEKGYGPTLKDIADYIGVKSPSTAHFLPRQALPLPPIYPGSDT